MMKRITLCLFFLCQIVLFSTLSAQGLKGFKLKNGLTVYVWEDNTKPDIFGLVGVKVGAVNDPENLTGLAHYLEHMMFKGTQTIGAVDWAKEKPLYDQIIAKYDEMALTEDPVKKEAINKEINKLTKESVKYVHLNEFSMLTDNMGADMLNAMTGYDMTQYFSSFPPSQLYKWLQLNSERFINPVFRAFQPELETVYEEFNRSQDGKLRKQQEFMLSHLFPGHPYSRSVLGKQEHLKNPQLSGLIKFYNDWYVPENMVLILSGNIKMKEAMGLVNACFGRLKNHPTPERKTYKELELKGRTEYSAKIADYPTLEMVYKSIPQGHQDELPLEICMRLLSNRNRTGLFDKLSLDGDILGADASLLGFREQGRIIITGIPHYDVNQRRFDSHRSVEKMFLKEIEKLQKGEIEEWRFNSVKAAMMRDFDLKFESNESKADMLLGSFIYGTNVNDILTYKERLNAITLDGLKEIAKKYFIDDYIVINFKKGKGKKVEKLQKPNFEPVIPLRNSVSAYAQKFEKMPVRSVEPKFADFNEVQSQKVNERSKLFYTKNNSNEVFTLTLKYGVGTKQMPKLEYAVELMNNAGVMGAFEPQALKQAYSELGAVCHFSVNENYLYVTIQGYEQNLLATCKLLTRQILMPKLDEKQLNNMIGGAYQTRMMEEESSSMLSKAAKSYLLYGNKSEYIDRMTLKDIIALTISNLTGEFIRATDYEAEIHYVGSMPFTQVCDILGKNLPLKANEKETLSPEVQDRVVYNENVVYFVSDNDAMQSKIYFFVEGEPYNVNQDIYCEAFNKYFGEGFGGLVMQEVREYRSMAYTAAASVITPPLKDKPAYLMGFVGTQSDKTVEAIKVFTDLVKNMPEYPDRITNIKDYLSENAQTSKPGFRYKSQVYEQWKRLGFVEDPAKTALPLIKTMTFDDIIKYYEKNIKGRPIAIIVVGDSKRIDMNALKQFGEVKHLNKSKLFSRK